MMYLIGGAPRVGKSIVAKLIAETQHTSFVSTDEICKKYLKTLSKEEKKARFPLPRFSGTASENILTPEERIELQIISAKSLEPEMGRILSEAVTQNTSLVMEGIHLLPEYVHDLLTKYGSANIHTVFIGLVDADHVTEGIMKNSSPDNWTSNSDPNVVKQIAEFVAAFSMRVQHEATKYGLPYRERTQDFEGDMKHFHEQLLGHSEITRSLR